MHAHNFLINKGTDRHDIEYIGEEFPKFEVIFSLA